MWVCKLSKTLNTKKKDRYTTPAFLGTGVVLMTFYKTTSVSSTEWVLT